MIKCQEMTKELKQPFAVQAMDLQLYAFGQQMEWVMPIKFQTHYLRLGGFHEVQCFIASISEIWGDAGFW